MSNLQKKTKLELINTLKALTGPVATFLNTEADKLLIVDIRRELKRRSDGV